MTEGSLHGHQLSTIYGTAKQLETWTWKALLKRLARNAAQRAISFIPDSVSYDSPCHLFLSSLGGSFLELTFHLAPVTGGPCTYEKERLP